MSERSEKISKISRMIIDGARSDLFLSMRYMELAISGLTPEESDKIEILGTDGNKLFYGGESLIDEYSKDSRRINRVCLHSIFHCLYRHISNSVKYEGKDALYWDIACDIAVEYLIDGLDISAVSSYVSRYRTYIYKRLSLEMEIFTAEGIYKALKEWDFSDSDFKILYKVFRTDDHGYWARPKSGKSPQASGGNGGDNPEGPPQGIANAEKTDRKWKDISERTASEMERLKRGSEEGSKSLLLSLRAANRRRYSYSEFLRHFAVYGEEVKPDSDSFDLSFYTYGLDLYGNMPIIEPLEYREVKKVTEFVIAVDTSASCSGEAIRSFLSKTFELLKGRESFFRQVNIHIIQCDSKVRKDIVVKDIEDIDRFFENMEVIGFGGTDFRPVFEYVEELCTKGIFKNLKGLIYFTDGEGIFPERPTPYDTAFVFFRKFYYDAEVPPWAVKLILDEEDLNI